MNMLSKESFLELEKDLKAKGGFSVNHFTPFSYYAFKLNIGFLVSVKKYEEALEPKDFTYERVKAYLNKEGLEDELRHLYFGGWLDNEGYIYLDMNIYILDFVMAIKEAIKQNQVAIYDLKKEKSIYLKDINLIEYLSNE
jgi:hypothetical protein